jgi:Fe-S oxidoreductase
MHLYDDPNTIRLVWEIRKSGLGATAFVPGRPPTWPGWEDAAVAPEHTGAYLRRFRQLLDRYGYDADLYGHFGQGCIHCRINFDLTSAGGIAHYRQFIDEAADLVVSFDGSLSGEHGDGQSRAALLEKMFGRDLVRAFGEFKAIWDPDGRMNPHKVVAPYQPTENLRLGTDYHPPQPRTQFHYPDDGGSFAKATLRCVGVGECRRLAGGTMCPSYMVTREEKHSTRGRARLLFEMMQGETLTGGWREAAVKDALDLCLACKGCKGDCPVNVDMATYKAEFLSHYYSRRLRPMSAYAMGLIHWWARLAAPVPWLANTLTHAPVLGALAKRLAGLAPERDLPRFAAQSFQRWMRGRPRRNRGRPQVLLWPDTFNNHFFPRTARAALEVLEAAGFEVLVPQAPLCCGRPLYDYGMLDTARRLLRRTLRTLRPQIARGIPMVALEPSCGAVFRDELLNLLPNDEDAKRLHDQTFLLSEFLERYAPEFRPPPLHRRALVHGHCHHKAIMKLDSERAVLDRLELDYTVLESGCCGMAGSFGFERKHYDVSMQVGERVLLPAVRGAAPDTLVISDGFSCREQIAGATDRRGLHLAEVLQLALRQQRVPSIRRRVSPRPARAIAATGAIAAGLVLAAAALRA